MLSSDNDVFAIESTKAEKVYCLGGKQVEIPHAVYGHGNFFPILLSKFFLCQPFGF